METIRFAGLAVGSFVIAFAAAMWLLAVRPLKPNLLLPTWHRVDVNSPRYQMEANSFATDNDSVRDKLRHAVLDAAEDILREPCNDAMKKLYIGAATNYARAWLSIAPCVGTRNCGSSDDHRLDLAQKAFGSPLDRRVHEAMEKAHETGALREGDFPDDAANLLAQMARDPVISPHASREAKQEAQEMRPAFSCRASSLR